MTSVTKNEMQQLKLSAEATEKFMLQLAASIGHHNTELALAVITTIFSNIVLSTDKQNGLSILSSLAVLVMSPDEEKNHDAGK